MTIGLPHVTGVGVWLVGFVVLMLVWKSITLIMRVLGFLLAVAMGLGAWMIFEYHQTGRLPF